MQNSVLHYVAQHHVLSERMVHCECAWGTTVGIGEPKWRFCMQCHEWAKGVCALARACALLWCCTPDEIPIPQSRRTDPTQRRRRKIETYPTWRQSRWLYYGVACDMLIWWPHADPSKRSNDYGMVRFRRLCTMLNLATLRLRTDTRFKETGRRYTHGVLAHTSTYVVSADNST